MLLKQNACPLTAVYPYSACCLQKIGVENATIEAGRQQTEGDKAEALEKDAEKVGGVCLCREARCLRASSAS